MPTPFHLDLVLRPGETFGPYVFMALDANDNLIDLSGWSAYAEFRVTPQNSVVLDLQAEILAAGSVGDFTTDYTISVFTLTGHGLIAGQGVRFTTSGDLPAPLAIDTDYFICQYGLDTDHFLVSDSPGGSPVILTDDGSGTHSCESIRGQVAIPEVTVATSHDYAEKKGGWDILLEDPQGRRFDQFGGGTFEIKKGYTNPAL
jgi:hypothetical protein